VCHGSGGWLPALQRLGFNPKPIHVWFVVDKVALWQTCLPVLRSSSTTIIIPTLHTHTFIYSSIHDCHNLILATTQIHTLNSVTTPYTKRYAADTQNTYFNKLPYQTAWFITSVCCTHDTHYILAFLQGTDSHLLYMTLWSATHNIHLIRAEITSQPRALCTPPPPPPMFLLLAVYFYCAWYIQEYTGLSVASV